MTEYVPTTQTPTHLMNTVKLFCPQKLLPDVMAYMMKSNVKYWPVERYWMREGLSNPVGIGYRLEMEKEHKIVPFLILKYDLEQID